MTSRHRLLSVALIASSALAFSVSCSDPVHSDAVSDLGDEAPGVRPGPTHRPGQPCLTCHGGSGPGSPQWSVAGTVYRTEGQPAALQNAQIMLTDSTGSTFTAVSNEVGNFYIPVDQWNPTYPMHVEISSGSTTTKMISRIGGSGSCADCHRGDGSNATMPAVYLEVSP